jgi:hypothetical protein
VTQVVECLPSKCEALNSNPSNAEKEKEKEKKNPGTNHSGITIHFW